MAEGKYAKPLPEFRPETKPFWDGCKQHSLMLPRSKQSGEFFFYPRAFSPGDDMSADIEWVKSPGRGRVWTFSIHHMGPTKAYKE
ncbi:MAG: zinc ribbon domain-containing protein, partial [Candidatus Dadabacteria bacterium]|nr:zinc ribbon domain-containing protein [Candidatus Dadabacteria bacterium]